MPRLASVTANLSEKIRRVTKGGREYLVAPMVALQEGVMNGLLYPAEEIAATAPAWNGVPLTLSHPKRRGIDVSAHDPDILADYELGRLFRVELVNGNKVRGEAWIDVARVEALGADAEELANAVERGRGVDVSTGLFLDETEGPGHYNGMRYKAVARNFQPDHVAILPNEKGACSWADGCGIPRVNRGGAMKFHVLSKARTPAFDGTEATEWPAGDLSLEAFVDSYFDANPDADRPEQPWANVEELPQDVREWVANHSLLGDPEADTLDELAFWPVVNPETRKLNANALLGVLDTRGTQDRVPASAIESAQARARSLLANECGHEVEAPEGDSAKVRIVKLVANALGLDVNVEMEESQMDREKLIKSLSECAACPIAANTLKNLDDEELEGLGETYLEGDDEESSDVDTQDAAPDDKPTGNAGDLEGLASVVEDLGGPDVVRELLQGLKNNDENAREELVEALKANADVEFTDEELDAMPLATLRKVAGIAQPQPDFSGRGLLRGNRTESEDSPYIQAPPVVLAKNGSGEDSE